MSTIDKKNILLTGASGFVGSQLLPKLLEQGHSVRCIVRDAKGLKTDAEVIQGDILDPQAMKKAMKGIDIAFFLVHALNTRKNFEEIERETAQTFAEAAKNAEVKRIIFLGGLIGKKHESLSKHLRSRLKVGEILRSFGTQVIEFRSSIILGSGSISYEIIKALTKSLPVMITPKWVHSKCQPIFIDDILAYLQQAVNLQTSQSEIVEIGGRDIVPYSNILQEYARQHGYKRFIFVLPVLTPWLSSLWLALVTPVHSRVGRKLIEGIYTETIVTSTKAEKLFSVKPIGLSEGIKRSIAQE